MKVILRNRLSSRREECRESAIASGGECFRQREELMQRLQGRPGVCLASVDGASVEGRVEIDETEQSVGAHIIRGFVGCFMPFG